MNLKFCPKDKNYPVDRKAHTNLGEFAPGEIHALLTDEEKKQGQQLVDNGDFVWTEEPGNIDSVPPWNPEPELEPETAKEPEPAKPEPAKKASNR